MRRIVLTGGPGGGKSTATDLISKEEKEKIITLPEVATIVYSNGFVRSQKPIAMRAVQNTIFHVQKNLENMHEELNSGKVMICDRGTVDGAVYWPGGEADFFIQQKTTLQAELLRYDAVLFFETAAAGNHSIYGGNELRSESQAEAIVLDQKLKVLWSQHPRFYHVPNQASFLEKIYSGLNRLKSLL